MKKGKKNILIILASILVILIVLFVIFYFFVTPITLLNQYKDVDVKNIINKEYYNLDENIAITFLTENDGITRNNNDYISFTYEIQEGIITTSVDSKLKIINELKLRDIDSKYFLNAGSIYDF